MQNTSTNIPQNFPIVNQFSPLRGSKQILSDDINDDARDYHELFNDDKFIQTPNSKLDMDMLFRKEHQLHNRRAYSCHDGIGQNFQNQTFSDGGLQPDCEDEEFLKKMKGQCNDRQSLDL